MRLEVSSHVPSSETWRLFFAVLIPDDVREGAVRLQRELAPALRGMVKWVEPENLHVTLKFIGNVPAHVVGKIEEIGREASAAAQGGQLVARGIGAFPNLRRPRVIWVGLDGDVPALADVAGRLDQMLADAHIAQPESRPFAAHLTLGRIRRGARPPDLTSIVGRLGNAELGPVPFGEFVLMRSHLRPSGPVYEVVARFAATGKPQQGE